MDAPLAAWLARQCQLVSGAVAGVVIAKDPAGGPAKPIAAWPTDETPPPALVETARLALRSERGVVQKAEPSTVEALDFVAALLELADADGAGPTAAAVAVAVPPAPEAQQVAVLHLLQLGAPWLLLLLEAPVPETSEASEPADGIGSEAVLALVSQCVEHGSLGEAAFALATGLAVRLGCERVSVGLVERGRARVLALSHSASFDERSAPLRAIAEAMNEAIDQDAVIQVPAAEAEAGPIQAAHAALREDHEAAAALGIPFCEGEAVVGALMLEFSGAGPGREQRVFAEQVARIVGPLLWRMHQDERPLPWRALQRARRSARRHFGADQPGARLALAAGALALLVLTLLPVTHRVSAPARLEGRVQRAVVAKLDGFLREARVRAGDRVAEGQVLAVLDDGDLALERRKWEGRLAQLAKEQRAAVAAHDRPGARILGARLDQTRAEIALVDEQLARTRLVAPFAGVIVRGDLGQRLGAPVERGELLFEIAPLDGHRIVLEVPERDIRHVEAEQAGELALTALPGDPLELQVRRVVPISVAESGRSYFRVEAELAAEADGLRPGMEGIGKIEVGRRSQLWIWTHGLVERLRLGLWAWLG